MLIYKLEEAENVLNITLQGDLDIEGTELINEELLPILLDYKDVMVSMAEVPFVDSSGMGLLINMVNTLKENNISIKLSEIVPDVNEVFELLQLPEILGREVFI